MQDWLVKGQTIVETGSNYNESMLHDSEPEKVDQSVQYSRGDSAEQEKNSTYVSFLSPLRKLSQS